MSPILVTLTSRSDSGFERSNINLKKISQMALMSTLMVLTTAFERTKQKFYGLRQTILWYFDSSCMDLALIIYY